MKKQLVIATTNLGKLAEFQALLSPIQCIKQLDLGITDTEETGLSFIENALLKARHASRESNQAALADDSGLVVPCLNGEPGIYSARYSGQQASDQDNIDYLLKKLSGYGEQERDAFFYCAIALVQHALDPIPIIATGVLHGKICLAPQGAYGFGYDSIFYIQSYSCTLAQLTPEQKNKISHRAIALSSLKTQVKGAYFVNN